MPIRTASLNGPLRKNGAKLHLATSSRIRAHGADQPPSAAEQALAEERRQLKEDKAARQAQALQPKAKAESLVRTHRAQAKDKPKARAEPKEARAASKSNKPSRAEKQATKAAALEAAKRATRKSAKT